MTLGSVIDLFIFCYFVKLFLSEEQVIGKCKYKRKIPGLCLGELDKFVFILNTAMQLSLHIVNCLTLFLNTVHILLSIYCIVLFLSQTCKFCE